MIKNNEKTNETKSKIADFFSSNKYLIISIIIIGLIAHGFAFTNKLLNHDEINSLFTKGGTYALGRWGLELVTVLFPNISMPWFNGIFSLILIVAASVVIVDILKIKNKFLQILVGGLLVTFPSVTGTFSYMFTSTPYFLGILLAVISVKLFISSKKSLNILGIISLIMSISLYQAYICLAASLLILLLIKECNNKKAEYRDIITNAVKYVVFLVISLGIYFVITKILNIILHIDLSNYQGTNNMGALSLKGIIEGCVNSYKDIIRITINEKYGLIVGPILIVSYLILFIISGIFIVKNITLNGKENWKKSALSIILYLMLPISANMLYILNPQVEMHTLMVYSNIIFAILPIFLYENNETIKFKKAIKIILYILLSIVLFKYIIFANESYLKLHLAYENTYSFYNTLVTRIESTEDFEKDTKVMIIGDYNDSLLENNNEKFKNINNITGITSNNDLINAYSKLKFIKYYIGIDFNINDEEDAKKEIMATDEFKEMNVYPYYNSIKKFGNTMVVKFSE